MLAASQLVLVSPPMVPVVPLMVTGLAVPMVTVSASPSFTPSAVAVLVTLLSPTTLMVSPRAKLLLSVPSPKLMPLAMSAVLAATFWLVAYNWLPFTASVEVALTSPSATLAILLPPLSRPSLVRLTGLPAVPLLMVTPSVSNTVSPAVTLSTLMSSARLKVTSLLLAVLLTSMLPSLLFKSTAPPEATVLLLAPSALRFQPPLAVVLI